MIHSLIRTTLLSLLFALPLALLAQNEGKITGVVKDNATNEPIPFANIIVSGTTIGTSSNIDGVFEINGAPLGYRKLEVSVIGYSPLISEDFYITKANVVSVELRLEATSTQLDEVVVQTSAFEKSEESPLSVQTLGIEEIEKNPGANRDISRVIQSLPGVASTASFRNDIIIRGGSPSENSFYLDEVKTPIINHFQTQGASGGPTGIINANLVKKAELYSGSYPSNRGGALSSVLEFTQIDGNQDRNKFRFTLGSSDVGFTADGPIGEKTTYIASVRHSYLQFLFSVLQLPFLPTYSDMQFKVKHKFDDNNELKLIGIGALDQFSLNTNANEGVTDQETIDRNNYLLGNIPVNEQWNYTLGAVYKHYSENSYQTVVISRSQLQNDAYKCIDNDEANEKTLDYSSAEIENNFRFEHNTRLGKGWKVNTGLVFSTVTYTNRTVNLVPGPEGPTQIDYDARLDFAKYGAWMQGAKDFLDARLALSFGLRVDGAAYNESMANPFNQLSPRVSASYSLADKWSLNSSVGRYFQLPPLTVLGFQDNDGNFVNEDRTTYIASNQIALGIEHNPDLKTKFAVEGFYKGYEDYPFLLTDSISLANQGADFGVVGNAPASSISIGRAYGVEFTAQRRSAKGLYGILAYTFVRSEFENIDGGYAPSSWDSRNLVSLTTGTRLGENWNLGFKWRYSGGLPFTPTDVETSALIPNWDASGMGVLDYNRLNQQRLGPFHQLDIRIDKTWFYDKWSLNLYLDIQNVYNYQSEAAPILVVQTDDAGNNIVDPNDPSRYLTEFIENTDGTVLPTIGIILDF